MSLLKKINKSGAATPKIETQISFPIPKHSQGFPVSPISDSLTVIERAGAARSQIIMGTVEIRRESCGPASMFSQFYTDGSYTDMKIAAAGDTTLTIRAHKVVLAAASPYLARKIKSHKGDEGPIVLNYINFNMLKAIIDYLYHGRVVIRADEVEDFHSFRRMFEVELGPVDGAREGEGQGSSQASNIRKRNLLLRGDGVSLKCIIFAVGGAA